MYEEIMLLWQVFNAVTMVSPLICLLKHRKKKSVFKSTLCIHIPLSMSYHLSCAFPTVVPACVVITLKALDYTFIHMLSLASRVDMKQTKRISISALLHTTLVVKSVINSDPAVFKLGLMLYDHMHLVRAHPCHSKKAIIAGGTAFTFYYWDNSIPCGHGIFHITLYWLFDTYFCILQDKKVFK